MNRPDLHAAIATLAGEPPKNTEERKAWLASISRIAETERTPEPQLIAIRDAAAIETRLRAELEKAEAATAAALESALIAF